MFWTMVASPKSGAHLICSSSYANHKVLVHVHHVAPLMHAKADAWLQNSSQAFHSMVPTLNVSAAMARSCWAQFPLRFFLVLRWITQSLRASR
jgi:hypothetical protein